MLDGLADEEVDRYLDEHPRIVPLFEVDVAKAVTPYIVQPEEAGDALDWDANRRIMSGPRSPGTGNGSIATSKSVPVGGSKPRNQERVETGKDSKVRV